MARSTRVRPADSRTTPIVRVHHALVRVTHWINVPILLGLIASGLSIYWAAPVFTHPPDPATGSREYLRDIGSVIGRALRDPVGSAWVYDRLGLGTRQLAIALRLHWLLAYLFMLNGAVYLLGLVAGGGWRALVPRPSDAGDALRMIRHYLGVIPMRLLRRPWPHPPARSKYNALQRGAYFTVLMCSALAILSGWAMHKPVQLGWLERLFVSYDGARIVHFVCMVVLAGFIVPHVLLVIADGWDTFRSMVTGWSQRLKAEGHRRPERPAPVIEVPQGGLRGQSRRDFLLLGAGTAAALAGIWWLMPDRARARFPIAGLRRAFDAGTTGIGLTTGRREAFLDRSLKFDDDVAEALYSRDRSVRTYRKSEITPLRNNYHGRTPTPGVLDGWTLNLSGLASGTVERLSLDRLAREFPHREQVTRLICVEGWSAIAWWGGLRFADLLAAFPPAPGMRWAAMRSAISLDGNGRPETYYVSIDLETALHPQTLLVTHKDGRPLPMAHGAPLRLIAPMKLGLKNIKGITDVEYTAAEPPDFWHERGYSAYDGL